MIVVVLVLFCHELTWEQHDFLSPLFSWHQMHSGAAGHSSTNPSNTPHVYYSHFGKWTVKNVKRVREHIAVHEPPVAHSWRYATVAGEAGNVHELTPCYHLSQMTLCGLIWGREARQSLLPISVVTNGSDVAHYISWAEVCHPIQKISVCASWRRPWHTSYPTLFCSLYVMEI